MPEKKDEAAFKVVDRRPFAPDGSSREAEQEAPQAQRGEAARASEPGAGVATADRIPAPAQAPAAARESAGEPGRESDRSEARIPETGSDGAYAIGESVPPGIDAAFTTLASFLGTTAMFQLGLMADPGGERIPADLEAARHTIDMLEVIELKTRGNLTPDESQLLDDVLYEVRIAYVEVGKRAARPK